MFLWWFCFFCNMIYPLCMILGGWLMWKRCPDSPGTCSGYRSRRSKLNRDTWRFANEHCGKRWFRLGHITLLPFALVQLPFYRSNEDTVGLVTILITAAGCALLLLSILPTEKALKETFTETGERRTVPENGNEE